MKKWRKYKKYTKIKQSLLTNWIVMLLYSYEVYLQGGCVMAYVMAFSYDSDTFKSDKKYK